MIIFADLSPHSKWVSFDRANNFFSSCVFSYKRIIIWRDITIIITLMSPQILILLFVKYDFLKFILLACVQIYSLTFWLENVLENVCLFMTINAFF